MTTEAMAELRRVCSGDRLPKDWRDGVVPPLPPPMVEYEWESTPVMDAIGKIILGLVCALLLALALAIARRAMWG